MNSTIKPALRTTRRHLLIARNDCYVSQSITTRGLNTSNLQTDQTFHLPDGRIMGYAEYGCQTGYPLMFFHGFPSSRLEARGVEQIARRRHIRIIAPDRPGFGLSTFQPYRRITDWPADVRALAHHLSLARFSVLGGSGGGPCALACAHALPREMISAVGIMAGAPPWQAGTQELPLSSRAVASMVKFWPAGLRILAAAQVGILRPCLNTRLASKRIDDWLSKVEPENDDKSSIEQRRERFLRLVFEGFAQGTKAFVQETQLLTQNWGIEFEKVAYDEIHFWHALDTNAPVQMIRWMTKRLPYSNLHEFEGESHWDLVRHLDDIVSILVPESDSPGCSVDVT